MAVHPPRLHLNGHVNALNTQNPGVLYVGGPFTNAGGKANADYLAKWNGVTWSAVNESVTLNGAVDAIAYHAGNVYVGGQFTNVGGDPNIDYLAVWDGTTWSTPCSGVDPITAQVAALQIIGNTLYVGGSFAERRQHCGGRLPGRLRPHHRRGQFNRPEQWRLKLRDLLP